MPAPDPVARLQLAQNEIDRVFGLGFSRDHPELLSAVLLCATLDFAATVARAIENMASALILEEGAGYRPPLVR